MTELFQNKLRATRNIHITSSGRWPAGKAEPQQQHQRMNNNNNMSCLSIAHFALLKRRFDQNIFSKIFTGRFYWLICDELRAEHRIINSMQYAYPYFGLIVIYRAPMPRKVVKRVDMSLSTSQGRGESRIPSDNGFSRTYDEHKSISKVLRLQTIKCILRFEIAALPLFFWVSAHQALHHGARAAHAIN